MAVPGGSARAVALGNVDPARCACRRKDYEHLLTWIKPPLTVRRPQIWFPRRQAR